MNIQNAIKKGKMILSEKKIKTAELDSEILMAKAINKDRSFVLINSKNLLTKNDLNKFCLLYTSPSPRDMRRSRMPSSA